MYLQSDQRGGLFTYRICSLKVYRIIENEKIFSIYTAKDEDGEWTEMSLMIIKNQIIEMIKSLISSSTPGLINHN